jgi:hypothetical protein
MRHYFLIRIFKLQPNRTHLLSQLSSIVAIPLKSVTAYASSSRTAPSGFEDVYVFDHYTDIPLIHLKSRGVLSRCVLKELLVGFCLENNHSRFPISFSLSHRFSRYSYLDFWVIYHNNPFINTCKTLHLFEMRWN